MVEVQYNRGMVVTVDDVYMPLTLSAPGITDGKFRELCEHYADYRVEYTAEGALLVMPPTDPETSSRNPCLSSSMKCCNMMH